MSSSLAHALAFARKGYGVFPVTWPILHRGRSICCCGADLRGHPCTAPAKHPYVRLAPNGVHSATTNEHQILEWFNDVPDANLGVHADGLIVIDIDTRDGGDESWRALEAEHGEVPPTWRVITGSKGEHVYFKCPPGVTVKNIVAKQLKDPPLGPGVDIRTTGGYLVAPPSRHMCGGVYDWSVDHHPQDVPLAPAPEWLVERLNGRAPAAEHPEANSVRGLAATHQAGARLSRLWPPHPSPVICCAGGWIHIWSPACCTHVIKPTCGRRCPTMSCAASSTALHDSSASAATRWKGATMREPADELKRLAREQEDKRRAKGNGNGKGKKPQAEGDYMKGKSPLASNVGNALLALNQEPELVNAFGYDEMLRTEVLLRPVFDADPTTFKPRPVTDADVCAVQSFLQWFGFRRVRQRHRARCH